MNQWIRPHVNKNEIICSEKLTIVLLTPFSCVLEQITITFLFKDLLKLGGNGGLR
ncbi:MAG: hypothetical protein RLZZ490_1700 [Cyanobacteriota bacterium]